MYVIEGVFAPRMHHSGVVEQISTLEGPVKAVGCSLVAGYYFLDACYYLLHGSCNTWCLLDGLGCFAVPYAHLLAGNWWCMDVCW